MKKIGSLLLCLALVLGLAAYMPETAKAAEALTTGKCGAKVTYSFDSGTGTLTIRGTGDMTDYAEGASPFCGRKEILSVVIEDGVTSAGKDAFTDCFSMKSAEFGKDVRTISEAAFYGCIGLESMTMQPDSVTYIGDWAFAHCKAMKEIRLPDSVAYVGYQSFDDTGYYLDRSNWENKVLYIGKCLYSGVYNEKYTDEKAMNGYAYASGNTISWRMSGVLTEEHYTIKDGTTVIADSGFKGTYIKSVTIPDSVVTIGPSAFYGLGIKQITVPDGVTTIYSSTFAKSGIESVKLPKGITAIGQDAFSGCSSLMKFTIPGKVTVIEDGTFAGTGLKSVTIPKGVRSIGNGAFFNCASLKKVTIKNGVRVIGEDAFCYCRKLKSVTIPKSVTIINRCAFGYNGDHSSERVKGFTIKGYKGSAAQKYAKENQFRFVEVKK